jgi:hypothetical protein
MVPFKFEPDRSVTVFPEIVAASKVQCKTRPLGNCDDTGDAETFAGGITGEATCESIAAAPAIPAKMVVFPPANTVARPVDETVATLGTEELHVTLDVRSLVLPSL